MLITQNVKTLTGGVTQQSPTDRNYNQVSEQSNCINSLVSGLRTRQGTWLNAALQTEGSENLSNAHKHQINRDSLENYMVFINASGIAVFDKKTGNRYPVAYGEDTLSYLRILDTASPEDAFRTLTSADTTYVLNRTQPVYRENVDNQAVADDGSTRVLYEISSLPNGYYDGEYKYQINGLVQLSGISGGTRGGATALEKLLRAALDETFTITRVGASVYLDVPMGASAPVIQDFSVGKEYEQYVGYVSTPEQTLFVREADALQPLDSLTKKTVAHVTQADYSVTYTVRINNRTATYTTPEATTEQARAGLSIQVIHDGLASAIRALNEPSVSVESYAGYIEIISAEDTAISVEDDLNNFSFKAVSRTAALFSDLPLKAPDGFSVKITGELGDESLGYWVQYNADSSSWVESRHPNQVHGIDKSTMPHILVRRNDTIYVDTNNPLGIYFEFSQGNWDDRLFGDDEATPFPSFVSEWDNETNVPITERKINAMTFHRNRLVFSSDENIIMSEAAVFTNFFRTSAEALKDSDPIDIGVLSSDVNPIEAMLSAQNELILYGTKRQYSLRSGDALTANTVYADPLSSYSVDGLAAPVFAGDMVFFIVKRNGYSGVFMSSITDQQNSAVEITSHVPTYIKGKALKMVVSTTESRLLIQTDDDAKALYVYDYKVVNRENVHSAWSKWVFNDDVVDIHIEDSLLSIITKTGSTYYSEYMYLDRDEGEERKGFKLALDRMRDDTGGVLAEGEVSVNLTKGNVIGKPFEMSFTLSPMFLRDQESTAVITGRLQVKKLAIAVQDTQKFEISVARMNRAQTSTRVRSNYVGQQGLTFGDPLLVSKIFTANIDGEIASTEVTVRSSSYFACSFQRVIWAGRYTRRMRQV